MKSIDTKSFFIILINNKLIFFLVLALSMLGYLFFFRYYPPQYTASAVFEIVEPPSLNTSAAGGSAEPLNFNSLLTMGLEKEDKTIAVLLGKEFLSTLLKIDRINNGLDKLSRCKVNKPGRLSIERALIFFGIFEFSRATDKQKFEKKISCLRKMISIKKFTYKDFSSSARKISVKNEDPVFAAYITNKIVDLLFSENDLKQRKSFKNAIEYLSKTLSEASMTLEQSKMELDYLILENPAYINSIEAADNGVLIYSGEVIGRRYTELSSYEMKLKKTEKTIFLVKDKLNVVLLENLKLALNDSISYNFSNSFIYRLRQAGLDRLENVPLSNSLLELVKEELLRLENSYDETTKRFNALENEIEGLLELDKEIRRLVSNTNSNQVFLKTISQNLKQQSLEAGLSLLT